VNAPGNQADPNEQATQAIKGNHELNSGGDATG
jgi:hypothetical protein